MHMCVNCISVRGTDQNSLPNFWQRAAVQQHLEGNVRAEGSGQRELIEAVERAQEEAKRVNAAMEEQARAMAEETRRQVAAALEAQARVMADERRLHEEQTRILEAEIFELRRQNPETAGRSMQPYSKHH
jgi:hypothetical protein